MIETREHKIVRHYHIALNNAVRDLMRVLEPGNESQWGGDTHEVLLSKAVARLQEERRVLVGEPLPISEEALAIE